MFSRLPCADICASGSSCRESAPATAATVSRLPATNSTSTQGMLSVAATRLAISECLLALRGSSRNLERRQQHMTDLQRRPPRLIGAPDDTAQHEMHKRTAEYSSLVVRLRRARQSETWTCARLWAVTLTRPSCDPHAILQNGTRVVPYQGRTSATLQQLSEVRPCGPAGGNSEVRPSM
jgi:hypothetical protein